MESFGTGFWIDYIKEQVLILEEGIMKTGQDIVGKIRAQYNGERNRILNVERESITTRIKLFSADQYSFIINELSLVHKNIDEDEQRIKKQIDFVQQTITYLPERMRLVEWDTSTNQAQLRSEKPAQIDDKKHYFEIFLNGGTRLTLKRFSFAFMDENRIQVTYTLSDEILARLLQDLTTCLTLRSDSASNE